MCKCLSIYRQKTHTHTKNTHGSPCGHPPKKSLPAPRIRPGDIALAAGFIAYAGPFTAEFRARPSSHPPGGNGYYNLGHWSIYG